MKILALGGCGNMGREAVRTLLLESEKIERVMVADINLEGARKFVETLGDPRVEAMKVDVMNRIELIEVLRGNDLVLNTVGPFYRYALSVAKAAIEARVNYMDICDDVEPTIELLKLDRDARDAGIFILLGMGASPGLTNLIARELAEQLDQVEEIVTAWVVGEEIEEEKVKGFSDGLAVIEHMLHACTSEIITFRGGQRVKIPAFREGLELPFPEPLGPYTCYHVAHPEVVTLPDHIQGVRTVSNLGSLYPPVSNEVVRSFIAEIEAGKRTIQNAAVELRRLSEMFKQSRKEMQLAEILPGGLYVAAIGTKNGKRGQQYYSACSTLPMSMSTSQPLACAALHIAHSGSIDPGVHPPEAVFRFGDIVGLAARYDLPLIKEEMTKTEMGWSERVISVEKH